MKVASILTVLVAAALVAPAYSAPAAFPTHTSSKNATVTDEEAFLLSRHVKYNYKEMAILAAQYEQAMASSRPRSNAAAKASPRTDIIPVCVGFATGPVRVRLFKNKLTCDTKGWSTLYTFTVHTKKEDYLAARPMCSALGLDERRSYLFFDKTNCAGGEWKDDFSFYRSSNVYTQTEIWVAPNPQRMLLYPTYPGSDHGWTINSAVQYRSYFRLSPDKEMKIFKGDYVHHLEVHKKLSISSTPDAATLRCVSLMAETMPNAKLTTSGTVVNDDGQHLPGYSAFAYDAKCTNLVLSSKVRGNQATSGGFGSAELIINNKVYAAISMKQGVEFTGRYLKQAFLESMRSGAPVMVSENSKYDLSDAIVAYIQGTAFTIGNAQIWDAVI
ncbi:hypothetical protein FBU30_001985 [Linnemannia zychae]|nr:hypothetical protein FBU30_001985 [Linnemannia zychae]